MGGHSITYYSNMDHYPNKLLHVFEEDPILTEDEFIDMMLSKVLNNEYIENGNLRDYYSLWIQDNKDNLKALWKYGYQLSISGDIDKSTYESIYEFIKTGILLKKDEEQ